MDYKQFKEDFYVEQSIFSFIGLTIITGGVYGFYWGLRFFETANKKYGIKDEVTNIPLFYLYMAMFLFYFLLPLLFFGLANDAIASEAASLFGSGSKVISIMVIVLIFATLYFLVFSAVSKWTLEMLLEKNNVPPIKNKLMLVGDRTIALIFNCFYFYFVLNQIERFALKEEAPKVELSKMDLSGAEASGS